MAVFRLYPYLKKAPVARRLLSRRVLSLHDPDALPRRIHLYWDQGLAAAPEIVRMCVASWARMNPGWTVTVLDRAAADRVLPFAGLPAGIRLAHYADLLRAELLATQGGVWADATVWCNRPLDDWLPIVMTQTGFFAFHRPGPDRMLSSWFLAAVPGDPAVTAWRDIEGRLWHGPLAGSRVYFWSHYLFEYLWLTSAAQRRAWDAVPSVDAAGPHALQQVLRAGRAPTPAEAAAIRVAPMHKLTYRWPVPAEAVLATLARVKAPGAAAQAVQTGQTGPAVAAAPYPAGVPETAAGAKRA